MTWRSRLILLFLVMIIGGSIWLKTIPHRQEVAPRDWQIYTNSNIGLQFSYPPDGTIEENYAENYFLKTGIHWYEITLKKPGIHGVVSVNSPGFGPPHLMNAKQSTIRIGGTTAVCEIGDVTPALQTPERSPHTTTVSLNKDGHKILFEFNYEEGDTQLEEVTKQILSSVQFIHS